MINLHRKFARLLFAYLLVLILPSLSPAQARRLRIAILDFGPSRTGTVVGDTIRSMFDLNGPGSPSRDFELLDQALATSAVRGVGYSGSLNMSRREARDLGAAMGCDYYFLGEAQTLRRSASSRPIYYETYASIFLVSARTGRLILWERPSVEAAFSEESLKQFMIILSDAKSHYVSVLKKASEDERAERAAAVAATVPIIEVLSDDDADKNKEVQAPRPYRRLKPPYPETAGRAEVEATIDVLVDIDAKGEVGHVEIDRWAGYGLEESVISTVKQMHFFPALRDGVAVPLRVLLRYNFRKPAQNQLP